MRCHAHHFGVLAPDDVRMGVRDMFWSAYWRACEWALGAWAWRVWALAWAWALGVGVGRWRGRWRGHWRGRWRGRGVGVGVESLGVGVKRGRGSERGQCLLGGGRGCGSSSVQ